MSGFVIILLGCDSTRIKNEVTREVQITESHLIQMGCRQQTGYLRYGEHQTWISQNEAL